MNDYYSASFRGGEPYTPNIHRLSLNNRRMPDSRTGSSMERNDENGKSFDYKLAMVYSPVQRFQNLYERTQALNRGTIFRELDKPFTGETVGGRK